MESTVIIRAACFADITKVPLDPGYTLDAPDTIFESDEWFGRHAMTVEKNGSPIAVIGVKPIWEGVGHVFGFVDKDAHKHSKTLVIAGRQILEIGESKFGFWRLQATCDTKFQGGLNYLRVMGFTIDGLMPMFGPDKSDHLMMSRLIDG